METTLHLNQKRPNKHPKNKKKRPLKVVYITNPMKFKTSPSEFKALVQQLTGKDADYSSQSADFPVLDGVGGSCGEAAEANVAGKSVADSVVAVEEAAREMEHPPINGEGLRKGIDPSVFRSDDDVPYNPQTMEIFQDSDLLDILQSLDKTYN